MALVSYGASDDSDYSEDEDATEAILVSKKTEIKVSGDSVDKSLDGGHISDEEDFFTSESAGGGSILDEPAEPDLISLIAKKLPQVKTVQKAHLPSALADEKEDLASIPAKKDYGAKPEEPPAKRMKKTKGPVKISIPSLATFEDEDEEEKPTPRIQQSKTGSGLFSLLPQPKNKMSRPSRPTGINPVLSNSQEPKAGGSLSSNNLKPQAVRKVGLIPHRVANPVKPKPGPSRPDSTNSDSDSDEDFLGVGGTVNSGSYFPAPAPPSNNKYKKVNAAPQTSTVSYPGMPNPSPMPSHSSLPPTLPPDNSFVSFNMSDDISATGTPYQDLGPAVAPYPPPMPRDMQANQGGSIVDNEQAIRRLAGKQNRLKEDKEDTGFIEVNEDDMKGDPLVWMTKAMTEEKAPRPTGKGPKGLAKSRHQITYLAHQAKERDWELKQDWATARENRRASANKYGFL